MRNNIAKIFVSIAIVAFTVSESKAQLKANSSLLSVSGAYTIIGIKETDQNLGGGGFQIGYETVNGKKNLGLGFALGYLVGLEEDEDQQVRYGTAPLWFYGKYFLGPEKAKFYFSGGIGYQISERKYSGNLAVPAVSVSSWDAGISFGLGAGLNYFFNDQIFGIVSYNAQFFRNRYYKNGMAHVFNFGIGFQF